MNRPGSVVEFKGTRSYGNRRPNRTFTRGRVCEAEGCGTVLSIYSKWKYCWQHQPVRPYFERGKRKRAEAA